MSTTPTRPPAVASPTTTECAAPSSTAPGLRTQSLHDLGSSSAPQQSRADQLATGAERAFELSGPARRFLRDSLVIGLEDHPWVNEPQWPALRAELEAFELFISTVPAALHQGAVEKAPPSPAKPVELEKRLTLGEYIRAHNATAGADEFSDAVQALGTCARVRVHAASQASLSPAFGGRGVPRLESLLSTEFWSNVSFVLDTLHARCLEELQRRDEARRDAARAERQAVSR